MAPNAHPPQITSASSVKEILYEGDYYDVTNFIKQHPGGSIIEFYVEHGQDATHAVQQFHQRSSKKVKVMMQSFPKREATDRQVVLGTEKLKRHRALTEDFNTLYLELEKEGMFKPSYLHNIYRILEAIAIGYLGYLLIFSQFYTVKLLGCLLLALGQSRTGWMMHEAGHNSMTGNPKVDKVLHKIICGTGVGMSSTWWQKGHNRHHAMPQRLHRDIDLDTLPLIATNVAIVGEREKGSFLLQNQSTPDYMGCAQIKGQLPTIRWVQGPGSKLALYKGRAHVADRVSTLSDVRSFNPISIRGVVCSVVLLVNVCELSDTFSVERPLPAENSSSKRR
ncbi:Fatty acid desaturase 2 [Folsomia candida]|uniref:Fatty acid desaturase 2 n=1 Tax=Folsomia candida TaxID=158441 RepID=A0A226DMT6_FOLCA|nr:Fatty acid desaturase 2 [Folsomia candida]